MKKLQYLIFAVTLLSSCTTPQFVTLQDKDGNPIHTATPSTFFSSPDKASEWGFWYVVLLAFAVWLVWREFKTVKWPKKKEDKRVINNTEE